MKSNKTRRAGRRFERADRSKPSTCLFLNTCSGCDATQPRHDKLEGEVLAEGQEEACADSIRWILLDESLLSTYGTWNEQQHQAIDEILRRLSPPSRSTPLEPASALISATSVNKPDLGPILLRTGRNRPRMSGLDSPCSGSGVTQPCHLPEDVCGLVCDAVRDLPRAVAASTLLSLSLVSRSWAAAAQSALLYDPFLSFDAPDTIAPRTFERLSALLQTLVARPDLSRTVRKFDLGCYTTRCQTEARVDRRRVSRLSVDLVAACPALKSISLPFVTQADKPYLIDALRKLELLETLIIGEGTSSPDPWVINVDIGIKDAWGCARWFREDFVALSAHWPRLRRLILEARVRARDTDDEHGVQWELEEFRLDLQRHGRLAFRQVDLLLAGSGNGSLKRLHVKEHQLADDALVQLVKHYGSNLTSLTTLTADHFTRHDELFGAIATFCPSLRSVHLSTPVYDLLPCLRHLLQTHRLQHLALATVIAPATCSPDLVAELVALVHNAPSLEELNIALGTHHVTDRGNTTAFARVLAEASRTLTSSHSKATLTLLPTWGPM